MTISGLRVKICGVTRPVDAVRAAELGATWIGINFWPRSPRCVSPERAVEIADAVRDRVELVGVFVNQRPEAVNAIRTEVGLDRVQLHGDEPPEEVRAYGRSAIQVVGVDETFDPEVLASYPEVWGFLFDVKDPVRYGGTGRSWAYERVRDLPTEKPILVAGGIGPGNVSRVISRCRPGGIDVCSRIETEPGVKDWNAMKSLFEEVDGGEATDRT